MIAPKAKFVYYPGTIRIPTGLRKPADLVVPLDNVFRRMKVNHHAAEATDLGDAGRTLETSAGDVAAVANLLANLVGKAARETPLCIIDSYNKGMLVSRTEQRYFIVPPLLALHRVKLPRTHRGLAQQRKSI